MKKVVTLVYVGVKHCSQEFRVQASLILLSLIFLNNIFFFISRKLLSVDAFLEEGLASSGDEVESTQEKPQKDKHKPKLSESRKPEQKGKSRFVLLTCLMQKFCIN